MMRESSNALHRFQRVKESSKDSKVQGNVNHKEYRRQTKRNIVATGYRMKQMSLRKD